MGDEWKNADELGQRSRLYDIDLIINRALVYGALMAILAAVYVLGVVGLGGLLREATGRENNSLVVAASTLVVAALFRPARDRVQGFIDRRFYRSRYNATQILEGFPQGSGTRSSWIRCRQNCYVKCIERCSHPMSRCG